MKAREDTIRPPVIVHVDTVYIFATVSDAELYLEPWAVTEEHATAYDSEGRLLALTVIGEERPPNAHERVFGRGRGAARAVRIVCEEDEPRQAGALRDILMSVLSGYAGERQDLEGLPLRNLVLTSVGYLGLDR